MSTTITVTMANRNERHFLEIYSPSRLRQRKTAQSEGQQRNSRFHEKENPPSTARGKEGGTDQRSQRRRLFTRLGSKPKLIRDSSSNANDNATTNANTNANANASRNDRDRDHCEKFSRDLASVQSSNTAALTELASSSTITTSTSTSTSTSLSSTQQQQLQQQQQYQCVFASHQEPSSKLPRALFSVDNDNSNDITTSPSYTSPSPKASHTRLNDYRSKKSMLSSSKTRAGTVRLRASNFLKTRKEINNNKIGNFLNAIIPTMNSTEQIMSIASPNETNSTNNGSVRTTTTTTTATTTTTTTTTTTPPTINAPSATPLATPKRLGLWSPPGTSRLLRKYLQRTHDQEVQRQSPSFQSPVSSTSLKTPRTTGQIGLRLLDSGPKRRLNHRLATRPQTTDQTANSLATTMHFVSKTPNQTANDGIGNDNHNHNLLSPASASRPQKGIESYRHAHGQAKQTTITLVRPAAQEGTALQNEKKIEFVEETKAGIQFLGPDGGEDQNESHAKSEIFLSNNIVKDPFKLATNGRTIDKLSSEEYDRAHSDVDPAVRNVYTREDDAPEGMEKKETIFEVVVLPAKSNRIRDEKSGIFRSTRSTRRVSLADAVKAVSAAEKAITGKTQNDSKLASELPCTSFPSSPQHQRRQNEHETVGSDTLSSKGSLQSIWDALNCGGGESSYHSISSPESRDEKTNIVSRCSDCVNPMASTLMDMWKEEEKEELGAFVQDHENHHQADEEEESPACGWVSPPRKAFSSDLTLVYGLERVENLTLARPRALPATQPHPLRPMARYQSNQ